jgi:hypothetical protein
MPVRLHKIGSIWVLNAAKVLHVDTPIIKLTILIGQEGLLAIQIVGLLLGAVDRDLVIIVVGMRSLLDILRLQLRLGWNIIDIGLWHCLGSYLVL